MNTPRPVRATPGECRPDVAWGEAGEAHLDLRVPRELCRHDGLATCLGSDDQPDGRVRRKKRLGEDGTPRSLHTLSADRLCFGLLERPKIITCGLGIHCDGLQWRVLGDGGASGLSKTETPPRVKGHSLEWLES